MMPDLPFDTTEARYRLRSALATIERTLGAGQAHRRRLDAIDTRIVVSGTRGKSTVTKWLHDIFNRRGYDTFAKVTGTSPVVYYNGVRHEINRSEQVRLYENERELARFDDIDVAIFENQGIRPYTTRLVNEQFVKPDVVFITNVREDHLDTLGGSRVRIARSFARAVPNTTPVICGEQHDALQEYIRAELNRRNASVTFVNTPAESTDIPASECVYGVNAILTLLGEAPLPPAELQNQLESFRPVWKWIPGGRVYNAAPVNDVQSTELVRQSLMGDGCDVVEPLLNLRWDRRGRSASFIKYIDGLYEAGHIERVSIVGDDQRLFVANVDTPVNRYDSDPEVAGDILDELLSVDRPLLLMGNVVTEFMEALLNEIDERALPQPLKTDRQEMISEVSDRI
jgi:hypothetical protein